MWRLLLILSLYTSCAYSAEGVKVQDLTEDTTPALSDLLYSIKNPNSSPAGRKVQYSNALKLSGWIDSGSTVSLTTPTDSVTMANMTSSGTVTAAHFVGDGAGLTNVPGTGGGGGSGTINTGAAGYFSYYPSNGITLDDQTALYTNGTNVGIGSFNPGALLDVLGAIRSTSNTLYGAGPALIGSPTGIQFDGANLVVTVPKLVLTAGGNVGIGTITAGKQLTIGSTGQSNIDSSGNFGIGTTTVPSGTKLYVAGLAEMTNFALRGNGVGSGYVLTSNSVGVGTWMPSTGGGGSGSGTVSTGTSGNFAYYSGDGTVVDDTSLVYTNGTNVGIGTTAALNQKVTLQGAQAFQGGTSDIYFQAKNSKNVGIGTSLPTTLFDVNRKFNVTTGGNVGIGSTTPTVTLDLGTSGTFAVGLGTTQVATPLCVKSVSGNRAVIGYCTGTLTGNKFTGAN